MAILHLHDWQRYGTARPDYTTTNKSFLKMVTLYNKIGIKNCLWPLALIQQDLVGVDPFDPNLTIEQMVMIKNECKSNPWYYFREVVRIPPLAGNESIPFIANRGNLSLLWCYLNGIDYVLIQPRQTGKSVSTDCLMVLLIYIMAVNTEISLITKDDALRKTNVERLKKIRRLLPSYLVDLSKADTDNQFELTCKSLKNKYTTGVAQNSEFAANNLGRGSSTPTRHIDEGPFISFIGTTLPAALAAGTAARDEAERNGQPCGNIFTTTAGKKDDRDGKFMYDFIMGGAVWNESFLDAGDKDTLIRIVDLNATGEKVLINGTFNHRQLGYTDEWLYRKIAEAFAKGDQADRDFFNVWTSGTQRSPLTPKLNAIIRESEEDTLHTTLSKDLYMMRWYIEEMYLESYLANNHCILSIDSSEAVGRDAIAMVLQDIKDLGVVATGAYNETNIIRFCNFLTDFMVRYPNVTLVIEKKSTGQTIIDMLLMMLPKHGIDPFRRIYNRLVEEMDNDKNVWNKLNTPMERREFNFYDPIKNKFGFNTTAESRQLLYSKILQESAKTAGHLVRDKQLISELLGLVVKNDRIDHANSSHDDMVISWLLGGWFVTMSKNLSFYGIDSTQILSEVRSYDRELSFEESWQLDRQKEIKSEIQELMDELNNERCTIQLSILEHRLNYLTAQLSDIDNDPTSLEELMTRIKEAKDTQMQLAQRRNQPDFAQTGHWSTANMYR